VLGALAALAATLGLLLTGTSPAEAQDTSDSGSAPLELVSSWPSDGFTLWLPPRQARLVFSAPVAAPALEVTLRPLDGQAQSDAPVRLTRGTSEVILFKVPDLLPGRYQLEYKAATQSGTTTAGSVMFTLGPSFTAPGGGNHRHASDHVHVDTAFDLLGRSLLAAAAALALLAAWRTHARRRSIADLVIPRLAGLALAAGAVLGAVSAVLLALELGPDTPFAAVMASPAPWLLLPAGVLGVLQMVAGRAGKAAAATAVVVVVVATAPTMHGDGPWALSAALAYSLVLVSCAVLAAASLQVTGWLASGRMPRAPRAVPVLIASAAMLAATSLALLPLHAHGLVLYGDFADDLAARLAVAGVLLAASGMLAVLAVLRRHRDGFFATGVARLAAPLLLLVILASSAALLWLPPPASGL
jgi:methionine-rich copper-binding protein CopC